MDENNLLEIVSMIFPSLRAWLGRRQKWKKLPGTLLMQKHSPMHLL